MAEPSCRRRFKETANNPKLSGDKSRHAVGGSPKPEKQMEIDEARQLVREELMAWAKDIVATELATDAEC